MHDYAPKECSIIIFPYRTTLCTYSSMCGIALFAVVISLEQHHAGENLQPHIRQLPRRVGALPHNIEGHGASYEANFRSNGQGQKVGAYQMYIFE